MLQILRRCWMKRIMFSALLSASIFMLPVSSSAQSAYNTNTGCGLGNQLFKEIGQDSILFQVLAVTVNQTILFNQVFGITSGTLGCKQPSKIVDEKLGKFVSDNMDRLARDIASGSGESLDTVAELMSVPVEKRAAVYASLQENFERIYTSAEVESSEVIDSIVGIIANS